MLTLRPYQTAMIDSIREQMLQGRRRILAVSPTGSGKTCLTAHMIKGAVARGRRVWFLVHRRELLKQSIETLQDAANVDCGIIAAGFGSNGYHLAQVASIQTLIRRWEKHPLPDLIITDEAHHLASASWSKLLGDILKKKPAHVVGLTATPRRLDGKGLKEWFDVIVEGPNTASLIDQGYLAKYRFWSAAAPDLTGVKTTAGDYNKGDIESTLSRTAVVGDALAEYRRHCDGKRALVFMWSIRSSKELADRFNDAGIPAMHVDGETDTHTRDMALAGFRAGRIKVLSNVDLFGEGLDVPNVEAGFLMRPTKSLAMYLQQCGRILRPAEGKEAALIFDHAGMGITHGYPDEPHVWTLDGVEQKPKTKKTPIRQCKKCYAVVPAGQKVCRWCGNVFEVKPREVEKEEGELQEVDSAHRHRILSLEQGHANSYEALLALERRRGYKPGWARHVWNARERKSKSTVPKSGHVRNSVLFDMASTFRPKK